MNISYFLHISNISHTIFGRVSLPDGTIFKYESKLTCCNWKFCFSQGSKQWFIKSQLLFWVNSAMECTGKKLAYLKAGKRLLWSLACWTNFFHFHQWGLHLFLRRKNKNYRTRNASQSQDGGFLEDFFAVCPETWVALDTANLVTFFAEVWQKCTNFFLVQSGP